MPSQVIDVHYELKAPFFPFEILLLTQKIKKVNRERKNNGTQFFGRDGWP